MLFTRYTRGKFVIKDSDEEQIQLANEVKDMDKGKMSFERRSFLKMQDSFLVQEKNFLIVVKGKDFQQKYLEPASK